MKKFKFHFSLLLGIAASTLLLSACASPDLSQSEIQELYQKQFQSLTSPLQEYFSYIPEQYQTTTQLQLSFPENSLDGQAAYQSTKETSPDKSEKNSLSFQADLKNFGENVPLQVSGALLTLYKDKDFYVNIQDFFLFMGSGNAESNFITLLAQQLSQKWIILDKQETIGVNIVEIPEYSDIINTITTLYTPLPTGEISTLSPDYLTSIKNIIEIISNLIEIPITSENITLDPNKESSVIYSLPKKNTPEYSANIYLTTDTQSFTL